MFINFIRLSLLFIGLFANEVIFGMMLSTNPAFIKNKNKSKPCSTNIVEKNTLLPLVELGKQDVLSILNNNIIYNDDIMYKNILPYLTTLEGLPVLEVRLVCKEAAVFYDPIFSRLLSEYCTKEKTISPVCAFFDCVYKKKYEEVKWFLKKKIDKPIFCITDNERYHILNPYALASDNKDEKIMQLLNQYKINIYAKVHEIQKSFNLPCLAIKILSLKRELERETETLRGNNKLPNKNINYSLCVAACTGDIELFALALESAKCDMLTLDSNIPLIMWIAIKNNDLLFINFLLKDSLLKKYFNIYMQNKKNNTDLFMLMCFNIPLEFLDLFVIFNEHINKNYNNIDSFSKSIQKNFNLEPFYKNLIISKKRVDEIKNIINTGIFTYMPSLLEFLKNKNVNNEINEIYEALNQELARQKGKGSSCCIQ